MSRIYDSSAITQRRRDLAQAGSFINRIQNPTTPQTSYGPLQGNYDASIMNSIKMGQPKEFYRNEGCIIISNGCPCPPITVDEIISGPTPPVILVPGPVSNVQAEYGSVIVTWDAPTTGGAPTSYTLIADDQTTLANSVTITGITTTSYTFPTYTGPAANQLTPGDQYLFKVIGNNSAGAGVQGGVSSSFYAPYVAPESDNSSTNADPNTIFINLTPYTAFTPTKYILKTYTNDVLTSTSSPTIYPSRNNQIVVNSGLSCLNVYTFQVQLLNDSNQYSSFGVKDGNLPVYPEGPVITGVSNITSTTVQVNYTDYTTTGGFDLTTGGAICNVNGPPSVGYGYTNLTNTSVVITGLSPYTQYLFSALLPLIISFEKTINGFDIDSDFSRLPTFTTNGIAPVVTSSDAPTANNATIIFNAYSSTSGTPGQFDFTGATFSIPGASPTIESITQPSEIYIGSLSPATTYNGCRMTLTGSGGAISDPSLTFTINTRSFAINDLAFSSSTQTTVSLTFTKPGTLPGTIQNVYAYYGGSQFGSVNLVSQTQLQISGLSPGTTYDNVTIVVSDGTYLSMPSNELSSISTQQTSPELQNISNITWTTADINFNPYTFGNGSSPTGGNVTSNTYGPISVNSLISTTSVTVQYLSPGTTYNDLYLTLTGSGGLQSSEAAVSTFTTEPSTGNFDSIGLDYTTTSSAVYQVNLGFLWIPTTSYVIGNLGSNPTQQFTASLTNLSSDIYEVTITGLTSNTTYNNIKIAVTDGGSNFSELSNVGSFTTQAPVYSAPVMTIINDGNTPIRADVTGVYDGSTVAITFNYTQYTAFTPTSGELLDSGDNVVGTYFSVSSTSLVISGISPAYYIDYKIRLYGDSASSQMTTPFNFTAIPILNVAQNPTPNPNPITITYSDMNVNFGFNVSSGYIYVPSLSNFPYSSSQAFNDSSQFSPSGTGSYSSYIVLINNSSSPNTVTLYSDTFTIDIS